MMFIFTLLFQTILAQEKLEPNSKWEDLQREWNLIPLTRGMFYY